MIERTFASEQLSRIRFPNGWKECDELVSSEGLVVYANFGIRKAGVICIDTYEHLYEEKITTKVSVASWEVIVKRMIQIAEKHREAINV